MTETEKARLVAYKKEVAMWLTERIDDEIASRADVFVDTDARLEEYVRGVVEHADDHNLYELLGVKRFFTLLGSYRWNVRAVRNFVRFYECLRFNGTSGRTRYKLTPVQVFQFANIFGFYREDGKRLTRTAYIFVPRKFSKTTSAASLAVYDLLFGDSNAQAYVGANSYQQAKVCFDEIRAIMRDLDPGERHFRVNRELINFKDGKRDSLIRCLASNAKTLDGLFASTVILDEYSQARNTVGRSGDELKNVLTTSMGPRKDPLTVIITTASDVLDGPFVEELESVKAILRGEKDDDSIFASLFMPDVDDEESDPHTWAKVQPHLGVTVQPDFYAQEWKNAQLSAGNMLAFRTKLLNVFCVNESKTWIPLEKARALQCDFDIDKVSGAPVTTVAFDLSVHDDFSAVSYTFFNFDERRFYCHTDYYFPKECLAGHPNGELYRLWAEQGHLKLCDGERIDVRMIANDILHRARRLDIVRIGYDSYKSQDLVNTLANMGNSTVLQSFPQTYGAFNRPVENFEMCIYDNPVRIAVNRNPINVFCMTNCVIDMDTLENKKPVKASHNRKIDGTITMLMTIGELYEHMS